MVVKVMSNAPVCHRHGCVSRASLAYRGGKFPVYCSRECRRADVRANKGAPWERAWRAALVSLDRFGDYSNGRPLAAA